MSINGPNDRRIHGGAERAVRPLRVLIVEDSEDDAELLLRELRDIGYVPSFERVASRDAMRGALQRQKWDVVFSDHNMPGFSSLDALEEVQRTGDDTPFIILSGAIADDTAVDAMRKGAHDYVMKGNRSRLLPALERELKDALVRRGHRHAQELLREREEQFRQLAENIQQVFFLTDPQLGKMFYVSPAYEQVWGQSCQSLYDRPVSWRDSVHPDDLARVISTANALKVTGQFDDKFRIVRSDGTLRWIHFRVFPVRDSAGVTFRIAALAEDITVQQDQQEKVDRLTRIHAVLSGINAAIVRVHDRAALFRDACRILVDQGRLRMAWIGLKVPEENRVEPIAWMGFEEGYLSDVELGLTNAAERNGSIGTALRTGKPVIVNDIESDATIVYKREALVRGYLSLAVFPLQVGGEAVGILALFAEQPGYFDREETKLLTGLAADISFALEYIEKEDRLNYLAYYDALTGLPNRTLFVERVGEKIRSTPSGSMLAVLAMEIQRFSTINNSLGHQAADTLLKLISERLASSLRHVGEVARIGGACFAVAIPGVRAEADAIHVLQTVIGDLARPFVIGDDELRIAIRSGLAVYPSDAVDGVTLVKNTETALKKAEDAREKYVFYAPEMQARAAHRLALEKRLHRALDNEEFVLYYQPKISLANGNVSGVEALIRWRDPEHGLVPPNEFIPLLEETGMIVDVGRWALEKAGCDYRRWVAKGLRGPRVAVNVSPIQLRQKGFAEQVEKAAGLRRGDPVFLDLEITESVIMEDVQRNIETLKALRALGVGVAIDDFGTGYSSLSYIVKLPVNSLKIDRAFIADLGKSSESTLIVSSVISLAHSMNLNVVAEGVETAEQLELLKSLNCDEMQGYLVSRPVPADELEAILRKGLKGGGDVLAS